MKIRQGFVSNSSSSSFVVISSIVNQEMIEKMKTAYGNKDTLEVDATNGNYQFGWENDRYDDFWSKVNFAYLQAKYVDETAKYVIMGEKHPEWMGMLEKVLKDNLKVNNISWNLDTEYPQKKDVPIGYIDHQSASYEGENTEIFESEDTLARFLFSKNSYIQGGNDNE